MDELVIEPGRGGPTIGGICDATRERFTWDAVARACLCGYEQLSTIGYS